MNISQIEIDKQHTTPVENDVQRTLREAIELIRRVGLCREPAHHAGRGADGSRCAMAAIDDTTESFSDRRVKAINCLIAAIGGGACGVHVIDTVVNGGMPATEAMFAKAIELAGSL